METGKSSQINRGRLLPAAALLALAAMVIFALILYPKTRNEESGIAGTGITAATSKGSAKTIAGLPLSTRYAISDGLGRDNEGFHARATADGFETTNPMRKPERALKAGFSAKGVEVRASKSRWGLSLSGYGYGDAVSSVLPGQLQARENRVEYRRGPLTEWYVNGPLGLQQGFTLDEPPDKSGDGPLTLAMTADPGVRATIKEGGRALTLKNAEGAELQYTGLLAYDAGKRELPVWLEANGNNLSIRVDDSGAVYPIVVDPLMQLAKLTASDGGGGVAGSDPAGDQFGISVAIYDDTTMADEDVIVVGAWLEETPDVAPGNEGAAYVFVKQMGAWTSMTETVKLVPSDPEDRARFGSAVAISGDTIAVGALREDNAAVGDDRGAVYVFVRPVGGWGSVGPTLASIAKLTSSATNNGALLGASVDISGDTIVAGAPSDNGAGSARGAVYVFVEPMGGWVSGTQTAKLTASDAANFDALGTSVAIDGDTIVAGAPDNDADNGNSGAVYLYEEPGGGWVNGTQTAKLIMTAAESLTQDRMGISVDISGSTVVAGAHQIANPGGAVQGPGKAIVFEEPGGGWTGTVTHIAKLLASDGVNGDQFGRSVSIDDTDIVVGAPGKTSATGKGYLFTEPMAGWSGTLNETDTMTASDGAAGDNFGFSISIDNGFIVVGAWGDDIPDTPNEDQGSAYVFQATPEADLAVTKTDSPDPVEAGAEITYTITVNNNGPNDAENVVVSDVLPANTTFSGLGQTSGPDFDVQFDNMTNTFTATIDTFPSGETAIFTFQVIVDCSAANGSMISNTVQVSSDTEDPDTDNNSFMEMTAVTNPPPTIDCPANVTAVAAQTCPPAAGTIVNFAEPVTSDQNNCPVDVICSPASGSMFPVGTTTVTCTATDDAMQTAQCSFTVTVFNGCLQDEANPGSVVLFNTFTGDYRFCCNGVVIKEGKGVVDKRACNFTITHNTTDRRVLIRVSFTTKDGAASIQAPVGQIKCTITDKNITNNTCNCPTVMNGM